MWQQSWPQQWIQFHVISDIWKCKITFPILDIKGINRFLSLPSFYPNMLMDLAPCQLRNCQSKRSIGMNGLEREIFLSMNRIYMWGINHGLSIGSKAIIRLWVMGMVDNAGGAMLIYWPWNGPPSRQSELPPLESPPMSHFHINQPHTNTCSPSPSKLF